MQVYIRLRGHGGLIDENSSIKLTLTSIRVDQIVSDEGQLL